MLPTALYKVGLWLKFTELRSCWNEASEDVRKGMTISASAFVTGGVAGRAAWSGLREGSAW